MKKQIYFGFLAWFIYGIVFIILGCTKENANDKKPPVSLDSNNPSIDSCTNPSTKGRIIGFNPIMCFLNFDSTRFTKYDSALGPGYLIEVDKDISKDTLICYRMGTNQFQFKPLQNNIASLYLFKQEYQDSLKIKFNYHIVVEKTEIKPFAVTDMEYARFSNWFNYIKDKKEIRLSCVSHQ